MLGVTFGSKHSYNDWGIWLEDTHINPPLPKRYIVDVPARNGLLDLTPELTPTIRFENRTLTFNFRVKAGDWSTLVSQIYGQIHGQTLDVVSDLDPNWHWHGCVTVDDFSSDERTGKLVITVDADPFKLSNTENSYTVNGNGTITCVVDRMEISPAFELTAPTTVIYGDSSYAIESTATTEKTLSGDIVSFIDGTENPAVDLTADIDAVQDLHGYDYPWVGGAGKNFANLKNKHNTTVNVTDSVTELTGTAVITSTVGASSGNAQLVLTVGDFQQLLGESVTISASLSSTITNSPDPRVFVLGYVNSTESILATLTGVGDKSTTFNVPSNLTEMRLLLRLEQQTAKITVGAKATFSNVMLRLSSTSATFEPYENICPISGWDEVNIYRTGLNIVPPASYWVNQGTSFTLDEQTVTFTVTNTGSSGFRQLKCDGTNAIPLPKGTGRKLRVYCEFESDNTQLNPRLFLNGQSGINTFFTKTVSGTWETVDIPDNVTVLLIYLQMTQSNTYLASNDVVKFKNVQVQFYNTSGEYGSIIFAKTPVSLGSTYYGGSLDVTTGVLTVTKKMVQLTGNTDGSINWGGFLCYLATGNLVDASTVNGSCSHATAITNGRYFNSGNYDLDDVFAVGTESQLRLRIKAFSTVEEYQNYFAQQAIAGTPVTCTYKLATPQVVQLTAEQVMILKNQNNIWADSGEVEVTYLAQDFTGKTFYIPDLELTEGSHELTIQGTGTTKVTYTNGRL